MKKKFQIQELKKMISARNGQLEEAREKSDKQVMQIRLILEKSDREHQREMDAEISKREKIAGKLSFYQTIDCPMRCYC